MERKNTVGIEKRKSKEYDEENQGKHDSKCFVNTIVVIMDAIYEHPARGIAEFNACLLINQSLLNWPTISLNASPPIFLLTLLPVLHFTLHSLSSIYTFKHFIFQATASMTDKINQVISQTRSRGGN